MIRGGKTWKDQNKRRRKLAKRTPQKAVKEHQKRAVRRKRA